MMKHLLALLLVLSMAFSGCAKREGFTFRPFRFKAENGDVLFSIKYTTESNGGFINEDILTAYVNRHYTITKKVIGDEIRIILKPIVVSP